MSAIWSEEGDGADHAPALTKKPWRRQGWYVRVRLTPEAHPSLQHLVRAVDAFPFETQAIARQAADALEAAVDGSWLGTEISYNFSVTP